MSEDLFELIIYDDDGRPVRIEPAGYVNHSGVYLRLTEAGLIAVNNMLSLPDRERNAVALALSIAKWQYITDLNAEHELEILNGSRTCALCYLGQRRWHEASPAACTKWISEFNNGLCMQCPVALTTGLASCLHTPYMSYDGTYATALAELNFLQSVEV